MQDLRRLPGSAQARLAAAFALRALLKPALPSFLLCHELRRLSLGFIHHLTLTCCSPEELRTLSRDMIPLPHLTALTIGGNEVIRSCTPGTPGAALGDIMAQMPALAHLELYLDVHKSVTLAKELPLPRELLTLDVSSCTFESWMDEGGERDYTREHVVFGLRCVVADVRSCLGRLEKLHLPGDEDGHGLEQELHDMCRPGGRLTVTMGLPGHVGCESP